MASISGYQGRRHHPSVCMVRCEISQQRRDPLSSLLGFAKTHAVSKDTYTLFLSFTKSTKPDFADYDETAAWPVLIDEFVEYARDKLNIPKPEPPEEADDDIF
mmetsp:Transcript_12772/g.39228  ORF Transcript_12772/g.39228 Transcript_12772/m.39228 type:complete len:103 (+) Transcript_12772:521-829(+)